MGNGSSLPVTGYGDMWPFRKVLLVPGLQHNYISCRMLTHHGFSIYLIDDTVTIADWCNLKIIMRATADLGDVYRLVYTTELYETHNSSDMYPQPLPTSMSPAICLMAKTNTDISNTTSILNDPIASSNELILDSGCSDHMFNTNVQLTEYNVFHTIARSVQVANGHRVPVLGSGICGFLQTVYYVPALSHSLLSVRSLTSQGIIVLFEKDHAKLYPGTSGHSFQPIIAKVVNGLYRVSQDEFELKANIPHQSCLVHRVQEWDLSDPCHDHLQNQQNMLQCYLVEDIRTDPISTWHYAFGHPSAERTRHICRCYNLPGVRKLELRSFEFLKNCRMCREAKGIRNSYNGTVARPTIRGKWWFADVKGPFTMPSLLHENQYVFGIIEGKTRFLIQYYIKEKSAVFTCLKEWYEEYIVPLRLTSEDKETLRHIFLNTDMGECTSHATKQFLKSVGIELTTTCPYTPEHNMIIERVWRTIGESAIAMLITSSLSEIYWQEARSTACYLYNRSPGAHQEISMLSPYEQYYGVAPHVLHFKIFGSKCYATVLNKAKGDHSPKAVKGIFVGYQDQQVKGWKIYVQDATEFIITAHAHFENDKYNKLVPTNDTDPSAPTDNRDHVSDYHDKDLVQSRLTKVVSKLNGALSQEATKRTSHDIARKSISG